jgi:hypothetical protein
MKVGVRPIPIGKTPDTKGPSNDAIRIPCSNLLHACDVQFYVGAGPGGEIA